MDSCVHVDELSGSIKRMELLDQLRDCQLVKKDSTAWRYSWWMKCCALFGEQRKAHKLLCGKSELGVSGKILITWILEKLILEIWNGLSWWRFVNTKMNVRVQKCRRFLCQLSIYELLRDYWGHEMFSREMHSYQVSARLLLRKSTLIKGTSYSLIPVQPQSYSSVNERNTG